MIVLDADKTPIKRYGIGYEALPSTSGQEWRDFIYKKDSKTYTCRAKKSNDGIVISRVTNEGMENDLALVAKARHFHFAVDCFVGMCDDEIVFNSPINEE